METNTAISALSALAHEHRLHIFKLLVQQGPEGLAAGVIGESLGLAAATTSFHLKELSNAGLIKKLQSGRFIYYSADYERMNGLLSYLTENCCKGISSSCKPQSIPETKP